MGTIANDSNVTVSVNGWRDQMYEQDLVINLRIMGRILLSPRYAGPRLFPYPGPRLILSACDRIVCILVARYRCIDQHVPYTFPE